MDLRIVTWSTTQYIIAMSENTSLYNTLCGRSYKLFVNHFSVIVLPRFQYFQLFN